jgi:hypothetical protein
MISSTCFMEDTSSPKGSLILYNGTSFGYCFVNVISSVNPTEFILASYLLLQLQYHSYLLHQDLALALSALYEDYRQVLSIVSRIRCILFKFGVSLKSK